MHWYSSSKSSPEHNQIGVYDDVKQNGAHAKENEERHFQALCYA